VEFKVENLCGFLIRSKLMTPQEMQAMRQRWQLDGKDPTNVPSFLKWLIVKNYLTDYQAGLLSRGHVDDFFLGDYKILERIGRGRMAGVYKAIHPSGQVVAIKVLPPSRAKTPQTLARFQREARLSIKLKNTYVVRAFQVGESRGVHYLVMEYLEGETVEEVLQRRKRLPPGEAVRLIHQALLGLQHIHEQGMVHRDLKPANLMLIPAPARTANETTAKSSVKILDIGLAREFFDENSPDMLEKAELTGEGVLLGTPDYLAPEQARDPRSIDVRADIYSLGCTLYHLLSGQPPFPDKNILNQMIRHATETPKPLTDFNAAIPEGLSQIVAWMIAKQPTQRYPTPVRAAQAMDAFLMVTAEASKPVEETPQMRKYLTWLEMTDNSSDNVDLTLPPPEAFPKPKSSPKVPLPAAIPAPAVRKKRTGVRMPEATPARTPTPAAPAAIPLPAGVNTEQFDVELIDAPAPLQPTPAPSPTPVPIPQAAPMQQTPAPVPAPAPTPGPVDTSTPLIERTLPPAVTSIRGVQLSQRDLTMLGIGIGGTLVFCLVCAGISSLLKMLAGQ
jgi:eukaryotic-like serine/threonine-protein kinase